MSTPRWAVAAIVLGLTSCGEDGELFVDSAHEHLDYTGIWRQAANAATVNWQGSSVGLVFSGTKVVVVMEADEFGDQYRVILDGIAARERLVLEAGERAYVLATGLDPRTEHKVSLFKETYSRSANRLHGFRVYGPSPESHQSRPNPSLRIAFFGDSNMDGTSLYSEKDSGDSGSYYAFPASTARMLHAEMQLQARGGATLAGADANDVVFFVGSPDGQTHSPDFRTGFEPDVIVVNVGANDIFTVEPEQREAHTRTNYRKAVAALRDVYGASPHIVLMNAYGWDSDEPANYTQDIVSEIGGNLSALHFPWIWEQWHGSMWEHSGQAHLLARHIVSLDERWSIRQPHEIIDSFDPAGNVVNGGFEAVAPFGSFGWRYKDDGVERVESEVEAKEGRYFIRLDEGEVIHQATDATGDLSPGATKGGETYRVSAWMRAGSADARATVMTRFRSQQFGTQTSDVFEPQVSAWKLTPDWRRYEHTSTAPSGAWTTFHYLSAEAGVVEIDGVSVDYRPSETRD